MNPRRANIPSPVVEEGRAGRRSERGAYGGDLARIALLFSAALVCTAALDAAPLVLRAQAWTLDGPQHAHALTSARAECYTPPADSGARAKAELGRALFRSPALLGGPAARMGLSCNACHVNGRDNAAFYLPELTDRPGAADVTSEWSSKVRGDFTMNPRRIPDLVDARGRGVFGEGHVLSLEGFVSGVIGDEFQGQTPPREAFEDLIAYLDALRSDACPTPTNAALTLAAAADDVRRAVDAAQRAEPDTRALGLLAAQDAIGRLVERLPSAAFRRDRNRLAALSRRLGALRSARPGALAAAAPRWRSRFDAEIAALAPREAETYFNETTLAAALAAQ
jgi:hypothetical protein